MPLNRLQAENIQAMLSRNGFMANVETEGDACILTVPDAVASSSGSRKWTEYRIEKIRSLTEAVRFIHARD